MDFSRSIFRTYSQILFINHEGIGFFLFLLTLFDPWLGTVGMASSLISNALARGLAFYPASYAYGIYGRNGLFTGMYIASKFQWSEQFPLVLFLSLLMVTYLCRLMEIYLGDQALPIMSFPFCLSTMMLSLSLKEFPFLLARPMGTLPLEWTQPVLFSSLAALFFDYHVRAGAGMLLLVLLYSRMLFISGMIGTLVAMGLATLLIGPLDFFRHHALVYNSFLTSMSLAAFFFIPTGASLLLSLLAILVLVPLDLGLHLLFSKFGIPITTLPFNLIALSALYSFRRNGYRHLHANPYWDQTPEEASRLFQEKNRILDESVIPVVLPFYGEWRISQGHDSQPTHLGKWQHAWDCVVDNDLHDQLDPNRKYQPQEFFTFGAPILSPATATVVAVENFQEDNPIFGFNTEKNWGNFITLQVANYFFIRLCHLKKGSVCVTPGETVTPFQRLGEVGNSGRSPTPHLHFQFQETSAGDCPTFPYPLSHYWLRHPDHWEHVFLGTPRAGQIVRRGQGDHSLAGSFDWTLDQKWSFWVDGGSIRRLESWVLDLDPLGRKYLKSSHGDTLFFSRTSHFFQITGLPRDKGGCLYLFALLLPRCPFEFREGVRWETEMDALLMLPPIRKWLREIFFFLRWGTILVAHHEFLERRNIKVRDHVIPVFGIKTELFLKRNGRAWSVGLGEIWLDQEIGPVYGKLSLHQQAPTLFFFDGFEGFWQ